jgi:salicylate hydroxylase
MTRTILVAGAGIGGLCAALGLQNAGFRVLVFEQAKEFGQVGAGITIGLTASRALDFLGIGETVRAAADRPKRPVIAHYKTGRPVADYRSDEDAPFDPSVSFHQLHRADLHAILVDAVRARDPDAILPGHEFSGAAQTPEGVIVSLADGGTFRGDALIGCDGLRSLVRVQAFGDENPRFTGQVAWRFLIPAESVEPFLSLGESAYYIGPQRSLLRYLVRRRTLLNAVAFVATDTWTEEGWSIRSSRAELLEHFDGWNEDVLGLIRNAPQDRIYKWALFDREPRDVWSDRRVTLLGDAAHPMLPFLGLGAAMAIEDAVLLARAMAATDDIAHAFKIYEAARRERTAGVLRASRRQGEIFNTVDPDRYQATERPTADVSLYAYDAAAVSLPVVQQ